MRQYEKVLIVDDLGLAPLPDHQRGDLLKVIEDQQGLCSMIVTSQLPVENCHDSISDPPIADAIVDRLVHNDHQINLKETSMRKKRPRPPPDPGADNQ